MTRYSPNALTWHFAVARTRAAVASIVTVRFCVACVAATAGDSPPGAEATSPSQTCEGVSVDPWVTGLHERVIAHDGLAQYAIDRFGAPVTCGGKITSVFDGVEFGTLDLGFANGAKLRVETLPPESSRVTLSVPSGFPDEQEAQQLIRTYVARVGVLIDWSRPIITRDGATTTERYESVDSGINAAVETTVVNGLLTKLQFSMAL